MKKIKNILLLSAISLSFIGCSSSSSSHLTTISYHSEVSKYDKDGIKKNVECYLLSKENKTNVDLYFFDDDNQIPYIELNDAFKMRKELFDTGLTYETKGKSNYSISNNSKEFVVSVNDYRSSVTFDIENQNIYFPNIGLFQAYSYNKTPYDILCFDVEQYDDIKYVKHQKYGFTDDVKAYSYNGSSITLPLKDYDIPMYYSNNKAYIPLDLFNNFFVSYTYNNFLYNGDAIYVTTGINDNPQEYLDSYYEGKNASSSRSQELANFTYNSLLLNLDYQYGLKNIHKISSFREEFKDLGLENGLKSTSNEEYINALYRVIYNCFGDGHCSFVRKSSYYGKQDINTMLKNDNYLNMGIADISYNGLENRSLRQNAVASNENYGKSYYEDGDTAYVRFDQFSLYSSIPDYYSTGVDGSENDAFGIIIYANKKIKENPNIKNVVVDVATNGGGEEMALIYVLGWMLGNQTRISIENPLTHGNATTYYQVDVNLDGQYNLNDDTLENYNKFILTSNYSFSCGNALPCFAKDSQKVRIIGQTSGGGCSQVFPLITTDGTTFNISGNMVLSYEKNSHYEHIDNGATPDFVITDKEKIYDRSYTTKVVHTFTNI